MKLFIVHDDNGNITSIAFPAPELADELGLEAEDGLLVTEVDSGDIEISDDLLLNFDSEDSREAVLQTFTNIKEDFHLEMTGSQPRLVRKKR